MLGKTYQLIVGNQQQPVSSLKFTAYSLQLIALANYHLFAVFD